MPLKFQQSVLFVISIMIIIVVIVTFIIHYSIELID